MTLGDRNLGQIPVLREVAEVPREVGRTVEWAFAESPPEGGEVEPVEALRDGLLARLVGGGREPGVQGRELDRKSVV